MDLAGLIFRFSVVRLSGLLPSHGSWCRTPNRAGSRFA